MTNCSHADLMDLRVLMLIVGQKQLSCCSQKKKKNEDDMKAFQSKSAIKAHAGLFPALYFIK